MRIRSLGLFALVPALLAFAACRQNGVDHSVMEVSAVNDGEPVIDAQIDAGPDHILGTDDDFVPAGHRPVRVRNRAYNDFMGATADGPFGAFVIERVAIAWEPLAAGTAADRLAAFDRSYATSIVVPRGEELTVDVMLVPFQMKAVSPLADLLAGAPPFAAQARTTFSGHDTDAPDVHYAFEALIPVEFIGAAVR